MKCIYNEDEICTNGLCPMCADYCPVSDMDGVCKYEEREEERYVLTPKGCLQSAFISTGLNVTLKEFDDLWFVFYELMKQFGYVEETE